MLYEIRALTRGNLVSTIVLEAGDEADARKKAEGRQLKPISVTRQTAVPALSGRRRQRFSLLLFSQELLTLLEAGLALVEGLEALSEKEDTGLGQEVLATLTASLREGKRFSAALADQSAVFPPLYIAIVRAAERTSDLPQALKRYIDYTSRLDAVRAKIISAMIYPVILILVGGAVTLFLVGYVVPRFAVVYQGAGRELPFLSAMLLEWGNFAHEHAQGLAIGVAAGVLGVAYFGRRFFAQGGLATLLGVLPGIRDRVRLYELARLYLTLGMLLDGGIPVVMALRNVEELVSESTRARLQKATALIAAGRALSGAFLENDLCTPISLRMLRVGERSGQLGEMFERAARFYDAEISRWIERFSKVFEPLLMAAIGLIVGFVVVLLYMPIFELAGSLN